MLIDSHCHLDRLDLSAHPQGIAAVLDAAHQAGVAQLISVATDLGRWQAMMELIEPFPQVLATAGVHPLSKEIATYDPLHLVQQAQHERVVAIGETGLDYHYCAETVHAQQAAFRQHLQLAAELKKPVVIHTREAQQDTLRLLREAPSLSAGGVLHCFTEDWPMAEAALELGLHLSFSGIISFRNAAPLREVVRQVPLGRILIETDAPYLTPAPYRGRSNEPCYVRRVAECVAEIKGLSLEQVAEATTANCRKLFAL